MQSSLHPWDEKFHFAALERISGFSRQAPALHWRQMGSAKHREGGRQLLQCQGWLAHRHGSCSMSFFRWCNFMTHLSCTSTMSKACMEVVKSRWPRCATGGPQGGQEPSKVS